MKLRLGVVPCVLCVASAFADPAADTLVRDNAAFAVDLYRQLAPAEGNLFLSPYSISTALAMTYAGAEGDTASEMAKTLRFSLGQKELHPAFGELQDSVGALGARGHVELAVANSLWPQAGYPFLTGYLDLAKDHYSATITPLDYARAAEQARVTINAWVEARTRNKIRDIVPPGVLDALTRLVLVNAIYFKGSWAHPFEPAITEPAPFALSGVATVETMLMRQSRPFGYAEDEGLQILEMPYAGEDLSMLVLLPTAKDGLPGLEANLSPQNLERWRKSLGTREVHVEFPRFKMTSAFSLNKTLWAMGMRDAFSEGKANFAGMDGRDDWLYIGAVLHKAFVEVNEEGTEAAAATAVVVQARAMPRQWQTFRADHPFIFLIQERKSGNILFMGRVADPTKE
jgi:serpin B